MIGKIIALILALQTAQLHIHDFAYHHPTTRKMVAISSCPKPGQTFACTVTAYYTPVEGQERYETGSLTRERLLEGGGYTAARTAPTLTTIAASACFPFGTEITIHGQGTFTVLDRGGSVRGTHLDRWVGMGDAGRTTMNSWGTRHLTCTRL